MPLEILQRAVCYGTYVEDESFARCSRCKCAHYCSADEQKRRWKAHKATCREPEWQRIAALSAAAAFEELEPALRTPGHNTAALLERVCDAIRAGGARKQVEGLNLESAAARLRSWARVGQGAELAADDLAPYYERLWQSPGMPQFLFLSDWRSLGFRTPQDAAAQPPIGSEQSGSEVSLWPIGFLVRSCVWGTLPENQTEDGVGTVRDAYFARGALRRLCQVTGDLALKASVGAAFAPVPGLFGSVAKQKPQWMCEHLGDNVIPAVIEWLDVPSAFDAFRTLANSSDACAVYPNLSEQARLSIISSCRNVSIPNLSPDSSNASKFDEAKQLGHGILRSALGDLQQSGLPLLQKAVEGAVTALTAPGGLAGVEARVFFAFLVDRLQKGDLDAALHEYAEMEMNHPWDLKDLATKALPREDLQEWLEALEQFRQYEVSRGGSGS
ncbi:hypothetical protein DIPPA_32735 [Diplonema papillatum]|nr:hypothetical protein DIPPA_32735 [Diplonema papillatum]